MVMGRTIRAELGNGVIWHQADVSRQVVAEGFYGVRRDACTVTD